MKIINSLKSTPFKNGIDSLLVKMVNARDNVLLDLRAKLILVMDQSTESGGIKKQYFQLPLEISQLSLLPLSWTIVHPIEKDSPLYGLSKDELIKLNPEVIILIQGFDEVFSQHVNSKRSYVATEWVWNKKFTKIFTAASDGNIILELSKIHDLENLE